jgi:AcrR family transcriptional regulator
MNDVRPPRQRRSQETLTRFLEAAQSLLEEKQFDNMSVSEVVQRAGSSVGAFYSRFGDKEALLACLRDTVTRESAEEIHRFGASAHWETAPLDRIVTEFVRILVRQHRRHRGTLRALVGRSIAGKSGIDAPARDPVSGTPAGDPGSGTPAADRGARNLGGLKMLSPMSFAELVANRRSEITHPSPELAVHLGLAMVAGAVRERILFPELSPRSESSIHVTDAVLVEELSRAFLGFLGVKAGRRSE